MDKSFANIIILPMLGYFQYYKATFIVLNYFTLHYLWLFMVILNFLAIFSYFTLSYFHLF